jgi:ornithine cyclodeaminase/alanine dehydrogenase-like protein (mu-crystallin family)
VLFGAWLQPGVHINAIGATGTIRREIDEAVVQRADRVIVELMENAQTDCGDIMYPVEHGFLKWDDVHELGDVIAGTAPGRKSPDQITLFDSTGTGTEDIAVASYLLRKARKKGVGREIGPLI